MAIRLIVLGSGGHAKVVLDMLEERSDLEVVGCTSPDQERHAVLGYPVLGTDSILPDTLKSGVSHAFVAVGANRLRLDLINQVRGLGFSLLNAVSRRAIVSHYAVLGEGIAIMPGAIVNAGAMIQDGAIVNTGATVDHDCRIGRGAHLAPGVNLAGLVHIGEGALLGIGSRVIPHVSIGAWSVIGAGSVVTRDVAAHVTAVGAPAAPREKNRRASR